MNPTIDVKTLQAWLEQGQRVMVLDVRPMAERAEWAIPGSIHVDAYAALQANDPDALAHVEVPGDTPIVTVCGAGKTSLIAAQQLRERGLDAMSLVGGMQAWSRAWNTAELALANGAVRVVQVRRTGKGCLSYLIGSQDEAAVIDAALDPEVYLKLAERYGWQIRYVLDTHIHADHLSRSRQLAIQSGATLCLPDQDRVMYPFTALHDGNVLDIGLEQLKALHTPGHTLESTSYLLDGAALFTGDTLFLAGVGRPDLEAQPEEARMRAHALYRSLQRLFALPNDTLVLPGHTSEPVAFDRKPISAKLADIRQQVALLHVAEDVFVEQILAQIPPAPRNHHRIVALNQAGLSPEGDPTALEAGANRCAVA